MTPRISFAERTYQLYYCVVADLELARSTGRRQGNDQTNLIALPLQHRQHSWFAPTVRYQQIQAASTAIRAFTGYKDHEINLREVGG